MKRLSQHMFSSVFILSMAVLIGWLGLGFFQTASAANSQNHDLITIAAADISAYRWESTPSYYLSHQVWLADLTYINAIGNISLSLGHVGQVLYGIRF